MHFRIVYPMYVWLASVICGSMVTYWSYFFFGDGSPITMEKFNEMLSTFPLAIWIALVISFPSYLLIWFFSYLISKRTLLSITIIKTCIAVVVLLSLLLTSFYIGPHDDPEALKVLLSFFIPAIASVYYFKLRDEVSGGHL